MTIVLVLAVNTMASYNITLMEQPDVEAVFTDLTRNLSMPKDSTDLHYFLDDTHTESLDHIKSALVNSLIDKLIEIDKYGRDPDDDSTSTTNLLTLLVNRDFSRMDGLKIGDEIVASGDSIFMLLDEDDEFDALPILENMKLVGTLDFVVVGSIPAIHTVPKILKQTEIYVEDVNPLPTIPHGVAMRLKNVFSVSKEGDVAHMPEDRTVAIPLNYDGLNLRRTI